MGTDENSCSLTGKGQIVTQTAPFSWNTLTPEEAREMCRQAQQAEGLVHSDADGGFHLAARHADVVAVMTDPDTFSSAPTVFRPMAPGVPPFPLLEYDPPRHGPWREIFRAAGIDEMALAGEIRVAALAALLVGATYIESLPARFTPGARVGP